MAHQTNEKTLRSGRIYRAVHPLEHNAYTVEYIPPEWDKMDEATRPKNGTN